MLDGVRCALQVEEHGKDRKLGRQDRTVPLTELGFFSTAVTLPDRPGASSSSHDAVSRHTQDEGRVAVTSRTRAGLPSHTTRAGLPSHKTRAVTHKTRAWSEAPRADPAPGLTSSPR